MQVTELYVYPVKSLRGIELSQATLRAEGLSWDRQWMVVDETGVFVTQRQLPAMAQVGVRLAAEALVLEHPSASPLDIPLSRDTLPRREVEIFGKRGEGLDEGEMAASWLTEVLGRIRGRDLRLVRGPADCWRAVGPEIRRGARAVTAFADIYPFLVTHEASLAALGEALREKGLAPAPMDRFRPNIVVRGGDAFDEDGWESLEAVNGTYRLGLRQPCQRCQIPSVDQASGEIPQPAEPLQTLIDMNTQPALPGGYFGQHAILLAGEGATVRVGDELRAKPRAAARE